MKNKVVVIDSGVGGLTVLKELLEMSPNEEYIYFGDTKNCPYGDKTKEEIVSYVLSILKSLPMDEVKAIVFACNTASILAADIVRSIYKLPVYTVYEMAIREFEEQEDENILVLATSLTVKSKAYSNNISFVTNNCYIREKACPSFVPFIESGKFFNIKDRLEIINNELEEVVKERKWSSVLLGCTHFPYLEDEIKSFFDKNTTIINPAKRLAKEFSKKETSLNNVGKCDFYASGSKDMYEKIATFYLKKPIKVIQRDLEKNYSRSIANMSTTHHLTSNDV